MSDVPHLDATELARRVRVRDLSVVETVRGAIERIERVNPLINAVVTPIYDEATRRAKAADAALAEGRDVGPLFGVPILIKDLFDFKAGVRNSFGCRATADFVPDETSIHIQRLEAAGAIVIGKTNTPEFGYKGITDNRLFGPTSTPFAPGRNSGGSSGGSAAAVAADIVPLAHGTDAGGSIRIPAAWCGIVGFKPTFGRIPTSRGGNAFAAHTPFIHCGPLARTVRDAALMAQVMFGPADGDPFCLPATGTDLVAAAAGEPTVGRLAYSRKLGVFAVDPEVAKVVDECVERLRQSGVQIDEVEWSLPLDQEELAEVWRCQMGVLHLDMFDSMAKAGADVLRASANDIPEAIHAMVERARGLTALDMKHLDARRTLVWRAVQDLLSRYDGLLTPTLSVLPVENSHDGNTLGPANVCGKAVERCVGWCLTHPFNFTGHPAASVPAGLSSQGLPVGLQIVGPRFGDELVIALCRRVEQVRPWIDTLESVSARLQQAG